VNLSSGPKEHELLEQALIEIWIVASDLLLILRSISTHRYDGDRWDIGVHCCQIGMGMLAVVAK